MSKKNILDKLKKYNEMIGNLNSDSYFLKWCAIMNLHVENEYVVYNDYFRITIKSEAILIYNINGELINTYDDFSWSKPFGESFDYQITNEKYRIYLLIKVISDYPYILNKNKASDHFKMVKNRSYLSICKSSIKDFDITQIQVFRFYHYYETRFTRVRRDDIIHEFVDERWLVEYKGVYLEDNEFKKYLPSDKITTTEPWGSIDVETEQELIELDIKKTEYLINSILNSQENQCD
jgi:hypothetical protein